MTRNNQAWKPPQMFHFSINLDQINPWGFFVMNKLCLTYVKGRKIRKTMKSMPCFKNSDVLMWRKYRSIWSFCLISEVSSLCTSILCFHAHGLFLLFTQVSPDIPSHRATDCPSQLGQTTCMPLWNTPSRRCGPSPSACGCGPRRAGSARLCLTPFLRSLTSWCYCRACTPPLSCSSMTRYHSSCIHRTSKLSIARVQLIFSRELM